MSWSNDVQVKASGAEMQAVASLLLADEIRNKFATTDEDPNSYSATEMKALLTAAKAEKGSQLFLNGKGLDAVTTAGLNALTGEQSAQLINVLSNLSHDSLPPEIPQQLAMTTLSVTDLTVMQTSKVKLVTLLDQANKKANTRFYPSTRELTSLSSYDLSNETSPYKIAYDKAVDVTTEPTTSELLTQTVKDKAQGIADEMLLDVETYAKSNTMHYENLCKKPTPVQPGQSAPATGQSLFSIEDNETEDSSPDVPEALQAAFLHTTYAEGINGILVDPRQFPPTNTEQDEIAQIALKQILLEKAKEAIDCAAAAEAEFVIPQDADNKDDLETKKASICERLRRVNLSVTQVEKKNDLALNRLQEAASETAQLGKASDPAEPTPGGGLSLPGMPDMPEISGVPKTGMATAGSALLGGFIGNSLHNSGSAKVPAWLAGQNRLKPIAGMAALGAGAALLFSGGRWLWQTLFNRDQPVAQTPQAVPVPGT
jgi:hypothetical protein